MSQRMLLNGMLKLAAVDDVTIANFLQAFGEML